jgi:hypothetical protein
LLPESTCQTILARPLSGCIPEDLEASITSTLWKEVGVTSSVTRNLEETGSDGKAILKKWKNY